MESWPRETRCSGGPGRACLSKQRLLHYGATPALLRVLSLYLVSREASPAHVFLGITYARVFFPVVIENSVTDSSLAYTGVRILRRSVTYKSSWRLASAKMLMVAATTLWNSAMCSTL